MNEKSQRAKVFLGAAQLMVAILLILMAIFLYSGLSTGWFAKNEEVSATGMSVQCYGLRLGDPKIKTVEVYRPSLNVPNPAEATFRIFPGAKAGDSWTEADWLKESDRLLPGDRILVTAEFEVLPPQKQLVKPGETQPNQPDPGIPVEFSLQARDITDDTGKVIRKADTPVEINQKLYYLSSQLWLKEATYRKNGAKQATVLLQRVETAPGPAATRWLSAHTLGSQTPAVVKPIRMDTDAQPEQLETGVYTLTLELEFYDHPTLDQTPLRGDITKNPVVPSSFWREIVINEVSTK